jgi:RNA polymerase sigma-70 factor (family 1)
MDSNFDTNRLLIDRLRSGSEKAFEEIFNTYWVRLYTLAFSKTKSREESEEIIQTLFVSLWEKRSSLLINNLEQYLFVSLRNKLIDRIRSKIIHEKCWANYKEFIPQTFNEVEESIEFNDLSNSLDNLLNTLPEKSRNVFKLSRLEGYSKKEIAKLLRISEKSIEYHLTKSLKILRLQLKNLFF